jgi:integrase
MARVAVEKNISYDDEKNTYYVNFDYGKNSEGKRIKRSKTFAKKTDAKKALKEFEANKTKEQLVMPQETTLKDWLEYWMEDIIKPNRELGTIYSYNQIIVNHINPSLGAIALQKLTPQHIQKYYTMLLKEKNLHSNTVRKHHDLLKMALNVAVNQDVIIKNPLTKVQAPKKEDKEVEAYTPEHYAKLCELVKGNRLEVVVYLAGMAGLRREEICGLTWECVDFDNRIIIIKEAITTAGSTVIRKGTKNKSSIRKLYMTDELYNALIREKEKQDKHKEVLGNEYKDSGLVTVWEDGRPYRPNYLSEIFTKFVMATDLPKITLHGLRHTFASLANYAGATLFDIGKAMGHSTPATTGKIYTHMLDKTHEATMTRIEDVLKNKK